MQPHIPVLMMTAYGGVSAAVEAFKAGAYDYLVKPLYNRDLIEKLKRATSLAVEPASERTKPDRGENPTGLRLKEVMGPSAPISKVIRDIALVAASDFTVIIQGETGTGKELVARAIHEASRRARAPMIPLDCGAIPETLFEGELFGYERGAFTGATSRRAGKFEIAQKGTLFLDEVGNMPLNCQSKLLRAIQERSFFRIGGSEPVTVDVRLIVATNQDLGSSIFQGRFSRELYYRLSEFTIRIPPLRERKEDIIHLAKRFLMSTNLELRKEVKSFSDTALELLVANPWPGNVRQLRSTVRRAVLQADNVIRPEHLSLESPTWDVDTGIFSKPDETLWDGQPLRQIVRSSIIDVERRVLIRALRQAKGNKAEAARLLQVDYKTIHSKLKQYGIGTHSEGNDEQEK